MIKYRFQDQQDPNCYLCVDILLDGSVSFGELRAAGLATDGAK